MDLLSNVTWGGTKSSYLCAQREKGLFCFDGNCSGSQQDKRERNSHENISIAVARLCLKAEIFVLFNCSRIFWSLSKLIWIINAGWRRERTLCPLHLCHGCLVFVSFSSFRFQLDMYTLSSKFWSALSSYTLGTTRRWYKGSSIHFWHNNFPKFAQASPAAASRSVIRNSTFVCLVGRPFSLKVLR